MIHKEPFPLSGFLRVDGVLTLELNVKRIHFLYLYFFPSTFAVFITSCTSCIIYGSQLKKFEIEHYIHVPMPAIGSLSPLKIHIKKSSKFR